MQPGETITPGGATPVPPQDEQTAQVAQTPPPQIETPVPFEQPAAPEAGYPAQPQEASQFSTGDTSEVSWTASEYIDHAKGPNWFIMFGLGLAVLVIATYFVSKDILASVLIGVAGMTFGVFAARQPRVLEYRLSSSGVTIGPKFYSFTEFKSFSVMDEGALQSILLTPLKRFMPPLTIYYAPNDEAMILDKLADYLPVEQREHDLTDRLAKRLRF